MAGPLDMPVHLKARELLPIEDGAGLEVKSLRGDLWIALRVAEEPVGDVPEPVAVANLVDLLRGRRRRGWGHGGGVGCGGARYLIKSCAA